MPHTVLVSEPLFGLATAISPTYDPFPHFDQLGPLMTSSYQTSDVGEAFRPIVPPSLVTAAYGISWLYLAG